MNEKNAMRTCASEASQYDSYYDAGNGDGYALHSRMGAALRLLGSGPGDVLDAGMGPGRLLEELDRAGWTVHGIDLSPEMVAIAQERLPAARDRMVVAQVESLPFTDQSFDALAATGVLEYADRPKALREFARVLRPGGVCVVSYPNPRAFYAIWKTRYYYRAVRVAKRLLRRPPLWFTGTGAPIVPGKFEELLTAAGLTPTAHVYTSFLVLPSPLDEVLRRAAAAAGRRVEARGVAPERMATQVVFAARRDGDAGARRDE